MQMSDELPIAIVIVDTPDRVREFRPELDAMVDHGMIALDEVTAIGSSRREENHRSR